MAYYTVRAAETAGLTADAMRLEVKDGKQGCIVINDSYNSDISSLGIALDFMARRQDDKSLNCTPLIFSLRSRLKK